MGLFYRSILPLARTVLANRKRNNLLKQIMPTKPPIVHAITDLYKNLYALGKQIPKRDKFGIHSEIERVCLESFSLSIQTALSPQNEKQSPLKELRINIEIIKRLVRISWETKIYPESKYIFIEERLQEISKMASGWLKYINTKGAI